MRSKISFFNKGLFFSNIKRFAWTAILETVLMFFCLPFNLMTFDSRIYPYYARDIKDILNWSTSYTVLSCLTICVYAVVLAVLLLHYLHKPKMTSALHGLPVSRNVLFGSTLISGIVLLLFPIIVNTALVAVVNVTMRIGRHIYMVSVLRWALYAVALSFVLFAFATFVGMFVGNAAAQFVFTYILHFLPLTAYGAYAALGQIFWLGFSTEGGIPNWIMELPMMTIVHDFTEPCGYYILLYFIMAIAFLALALFAYKKRPLEHAGDIVVFEWVKPMFKYGISVCFAVAGFLYIAGISGMDVRDNLIGNTLLAMVWAFAGFCVAQMLVARTWRIFGAYKEMLAVCVAIGVLFVLYQVDIVGYEKRVPHPDSVASVRVSGFDMYPHEVIDFVEAENIATVTEMHAAMIETAGSQYAGGYTRVEYTLKNGAKIYRAYGKASDKVRGHFTKLSRTPEARRNGYFMFYEDVDNIESVYVAYIGGDFYFQEIEKLSEAICADVDAWEEIVDYDNVAPTMQMYSVEVRLKQAYEKDYHRRVFYYDVTEENMPRTHAIFTEHIASREKAWAILED